MKIQKFWTATVLFFLMPLFLSPLVSQAATPILFEDLHTKGTIQGTPQFLKTRLSSKSLHINSVDDSVQVPHSSDIAVGEKDFTLSFWIFLKKSNSGVWRSLMQKGNSPVERTFALWLRPDSNQVHFRISLLGGTDSSFWNAGGNSSNSIPLNQWTHIVYVKEDRKLSLYINGYLDTSVALKADALANTGPLHIGKTPSSQPALAIYDQVNIYKRTMTLLEVASLYQVQFSNFNLEKQGELRGSPQWVSNDLGQALKIDSIDDGTTVANSIHFPNQKSTNFTVSFRILLEKNAAGTWRSIMHKGNANHERTFAMWLRPNDNRVQFKISLQDGVDSLWGTGGDSIQSIPLNKWTHIAFVKEANLLHLYIDGILDTSITLKNNVEFNNGPLYIGSTPWYRPAYASYNQINIYKRALKKPEIERIVNAKNLAPHNGGQWSNIIPWPHIPVSAANLPDGRLLTWSGSERNIWPTTEKTFSATWQPLNNEFTEIMHQSHNMFCSHLAMTEDGKVFVNGGRNQLNSPWTSLFDYRDNKWTQVQNMASGARWYPTTLALPSTEIMTAMGTATNFANPEKWSVDKGWQVLNGVDFTKMRTTQNGTVGGRQFWPILNVAPNGNVFHFWNILESFFINTAGTGQFRNANATTLQASDNNLAPGVAIQYDVGKLLITGNNQGSWGDRARLGKQSFTVDLNGPTPVITATSPMLSARAFHNLVVLPTGEVLAIGGNTSGTTFSDEGTNYEAEIWNPISRQWRLASPMKVPRNYHSIGLLLTDGRVVAAGGGYCSGNENCNGASYQNGEIYSPPYLFNTDGTKAIQPKIIASTGVIYAGQTFTVTATQDVKAFTMIKMSSTTHAVNTDARFTRVNFINKGNGLFDLTAHQNPNVLIPGYWMLFALNDKNVPSQAHVVRVEIPGNVTTPGPIRYIKLIAKSEVKNNPWASVAELNILDENLNPINPSRWFIQSDSENVNHPAKFSIDGNNQTFWHSEWKTSPIPAHPHELIIDLRSSYVIGGIRYLPRQDTSNGRIANFEILLSTDGNSWKTIDNGTFTNTTNLQTRDFISALKNLYIAPITSNASGLNNTFSIPSLTNVEYKWSFGDGTPETAFSSQTFSISHNYQKPGIYIIVATVRNIITGAERTITTKKVVYDATIDLTKSSALLSSSPIHYHPVKSQVWNVNPDNNSVTVIDSNTYTKLKEISVGEQPSAIAFATNGDAWITNKKSGTVSIIDTNNLSIKSTLTLPNKRALPHGIVIKNDFAYVVLEAMNHLIKISTTTNTIINHAVIQKNSRHLALSVDGTRILTTAFITPPVLNEHTSRPDVSQGVSGVTVLNSNTLAVEKIINLEHSNQEATENSGPGIPNYLGIMAMHPAGHSAYIPSKQDNILSGSMRNGEEMQFDQTVRAIGSKLNLLTLQETGNSRLDYDNASVASASLYDRYGIHLFTALEGNRQIAVSNTITNAEVLRFDAGRAPQGLALSANGKILAVHNFMDRTVQFININNIVEAKSNKPEYIATVKTVGTEKLTLQILRGKQLFYDASDDRLAALDYMSCASCHNEGDHDGRVWDLTHLGEGLRNTISLRGKNGMAHGVLHWTGNFDEIQDFEDQIRHFSGGSGLMNDIDFSEGTRSKPLGDPKAGLSKDLDAMSAYISSLTKSDESPLVNNQLSADALEGKALFNTYQCASCHSGATFTDSLTKKRHDIGTINLESGSRLSVNLDGLDTPTLLGLTSSAPYLHNGSAQTINEAISAHNTASISASDIEKIKVYLLELSQ
ncbi:MAG: LamG-like jellyroll fold domain-containing protein [Pseudomonadota bacterium]